MLGLLRLIKLRGNSPLIERLQLSEQLRVEPKDYKVKLQSTQSYAMVHNE